MDALAQLAIMSKAATVFGSDETFLSFPVTPLAFSAAQLNLLQTDGEGLANLIAFSEVVNRLPGGIAWEPGTDQYLWNVFGKVLTEGQFAWSSRTDEEEAAYQHVRSLLFVTHEDGTRTRTPAVEVYRVKRDAYLLAGQELRALQATLAALVDAAAHGAAVDEAEHDKVTADEQAAAARLEEAVADWEGEGQRHQIEAAEALLSALEQKSPVVLHNEWSTRFDPHIATLTRAADDFQVYPTSFSPANAIDDGSWRPLMISGPEIAATAGSAPAELQERFVSEGSTNDLLSISFEFSSAGLTRPWLDTGVFTSKMWRFASDDLLSDGATPPNGLCTAYTAGVVFARKVTVERRTPPPPGESGGGSGFQFEIANMPIVQLSVQPEYRLQLPERDVAVVKLDHTRVLQETLETPSLLERTVEVSPVIARLDTVLLDQPLQLGAVHRRPALTSLRSSTFLRHSLDENPDIQLYQVIAQPETPTAPPTSTTTTDDSVFIVAFICKPLPRCPDPDPTVQWAPT